MGFNIVATHECVVHGKSVHRLTSEKLFSYAKLREQIRHIFQLAPSAPFVLKYSSSNWNNDSVSIVNNEKLVDLLQGQKVDPLKVTVMYKCSSPFVRVLHGDTYHLLTLPPGQLEFCYEQLHGRVRNLFNLPLSAQFVFLYKEPDFCGPHMTVASDEELRYALHKEAPNHLQLDISVIEEGNETIIHYSSGEIGEETTCDVLKIWYNGTVHGLALSPGEMESSCEKFQSRIRDVFKLPRSAELEFKYMDENQDEVTLCKAEKLKDILPCQTYFDMTTDYLVIRETPHNVVKVRYNGTLCRLTLPLDEFQFSYEKFRSSIRDLFQLPPAVQFVLTYIDEDEDEITMVKDEDLRDALVLQYLSPLKVNMTIIEGDSSINSNPPIALSQSYSCEVTDEDDYAWVMRGCGRLRESNDSGLSLPSEVTRKM